MPLRHLAARSIIDLWGQRVAGSGFVGMVAVVAGLAHVARRSLRFGFDAGCPEPHASGRAGAAAGRRWQGWMGRAGGRFGGVGLLVKPIGSGGWLARPTEWVVGFLRGWSAVSRGRQAMCAPESSCTANFPQRHRLCSVVFHRKPFCRPAR